MKFLYPTFPREVAVPWRKLIYSYDDFVKVVDKYNRYKQIYYALYQTEGELAIVDKIFFDLDSENCYEEICNLHRYLLKHNFKHCIFFSGRGYHCYIKSKTAKINKEILRSAQEYFFNKVQMTRDVHTIGNIRQVARVPNTFNIRRKRFCVSISTEDLNKGHDFIKQKSLKQCYCSYIYGEKLYDFNKTQIIVRNDVVTDTENINIKLDSNIVYNQLRSCIKNMCKAHPSFRERFHIINEVMNCGFSYNQCTDFLASFFDEKTFKHCIHEERQVKYVYNLTSFEKTSCEKLKEEGLCSNACFSNEEKQRPIKHLKRPI